MQIFAAMILVTMRLGRGRLDRRPCFDLRVDHRALPNQGRGFIEARVAVVKTGDVGQEHEGIGADHLSDARGSLSLSRNGFPGWRPYRSR